MRKADAVTTIPPIATALAHAQTERGVLGINDGLISNLCLILGVAGAAAGQGQCGSPGSPPWSPERSRWRRGSG